MDGERVLFTSFNLKRREENEDPKVV